MRQAAITILGGILALLGLGYACVQRELPRLEGNLPGRVDASIAVSHDPGPKVALSDSVGGHTDGEGIDAERLTSMGDGSTQPVTDDDR